MKLYTSGRLSDERTLSQRDSHAAKEESDQQPGARRPLVFLDAGKPGPVAKPTSNEKALAGYAYCSAPRKISSIVAAAIG